jgi:hypothetical protein
VGSPFRPWGNKARPLRHRFGKGEGQWQEDRHDPVFAFVEVGLAEDVPIQEIEHPGVDERPDRLHQVQWQGVAVPLVDVHNSQERV